MALRFNPPPNWPAPPEGFEPPAGWQPDPAWGPAPEGWQIWVDDSAASSTSAASAAGAATEADPAWAPTQAVSTAPTAQLSANAPVADPTGMSASAPSGDYAGQPAAAGASPYAASMDYAQSPTPYQSQGAAGGMQPPVGGWQPNAVAPAGSGSGSKPLTQQWWFWTGIAAVVVVALVIASVFLFRGDSGKGDNKADSTSSAESKKDEEKTDDPEPTKEDDSPDSKPSPSQSKSSDNDSGSKSKPLDPTAGPVEIKAGKYDEDPNASISVKFNPVEWDVNAADLQAIDKRTYTDPPEGKKYIRVPVEVTYHGDGQFQGRSLKIDYDYQGNTSSPIESYSDSSLFTRQDFPRDGGTAKGYYVFLVDAATANDGKAVFAVKAFYDSYNSKEKYVTAK